MRLRMVRALVCAMVLAGAIPGSAFGAPGAVSQSGAVMNDPALTPEKDAVWERRTQAKDAEVQAWIAREHPDLQAGSVLREGALSTMALPADSRFGYHSRYVQNFRQERTYYCGPASARQSLSWHKNYNDSPTPLPSQATLANMIGTTTSGSSTTGIADALNRYDGSSYGSINYVASDLTGTNDPLLTFYLRIGSMLEQARTVPIILTATEYIPRYADHASRHYMTLSGIDDRTAPVRMISVDPNYGNAYFGIFWNPVGDLSQKGLFKACYRADAAGTNKAMAW